MTTERTNPADRIRSEVERLTADRPSRTYSAAELATVTRTHGDLRDGDRWGRWTLDLERSVLFIDAYGPGGPYEIDLENARTPGEVSDWIMHLAGKRWATDADVGALVRALRAYSRDRGRP